MRRLGIAVASAVFALAACSTGATTAPSASSTDLTVYAAASLKGVIEAARAAYEAANDGTAVTVSTDSSAALATQIEQGAPVDVYLSADTVNPQKLVDGGYADGVAVAFAANTLAIVVPAANPAEIATPADLARPGVKIIAAGDQVPITKYAKKLVDNLAARADDPTGFASAYAANVVSREDNVKAVVAKVELGEGDAGIVYATDAAASTKVRTIDIRADANVAARYAGIVVKASARLDAAHAFLDWLRGPDGQAILAASGFRSPS